MKYIISQIILLFIVGIFFAACSDLQEDLTQPVALTVHQDGIASPTASNFHGLTLKANNYNLQDCQQCHGRSYDGGTAGASCNDCHVFPGGPEACNTCHGNFYDIKH